MSPAWINHPATWLESSSETVASSFAPKTSRGDSGSVVNAGCRATGVSRIISKFGNSEGTTGKTDGTGE